MSTNQRRVLPVALVLGIALAIGACGESGRQQATGKGSVRGINAIVTAPQVNFLIEERPIDQISFKEATGFQQYDDLDYRFNFDAPQFAGEGGGRLASQYVDFVADTEYTFVLTGTMADPSLMYWEEPRRDFAATETVFEIDFVHLSPALGQVDIYFDLVGTAPAAGNEIARMQFGDRISYREFPADDYELIVTAPADPGTILFHSGTLSAAARTRSTLAVFDVDPSVTAPVSVTLIGGGGNSTTLPDINFPPQLRLLHASFGTQNVDGYIDEELTSVAFADIEFGEVSPFVDVGLVAPTVTTTAVNDSATVILDSTVSLALNGRSTLFLRGTPENPAFSIVRNDARPIEIYPGLRIINMALNLTAVDIYLLEPGTPIDDEAIPILRFLAPPLDSGFFPVFTGLQELTLTVAGEKTIVSAPIQLDLQNGDIHDLVILDTADADTVEVKLLDSFSL